jgi:hypothetical protein
VQNAEILVSNEATHAARKVTTTAEGFYRVQLLPPGHYSVMVTSVGFAPHTSQTIEVTVSTERTNSMIAESTAIHRSFQEAGISYAALKGFSLWPVSVPKPELRSQLDLDFLIAARSASEARRILEARGYRLKAISGRSWEFKSGTPGVASLKNLYKPTLHRTVELHLEIKDQEPDSLLARTGKLCFHGICMPVLHPVDLFLGRGCTSTSTCVVSSGVRLT